jgi:hypothetical protein
MVVPVGEVGVTLEMYYKGIKGSLTSQGIRKWVLLNSFLGIWVRPPSRRWGSRLLKEVPINSPFESPIKHLFGLAAVSIAPIARYVCGRYAMTRSPD